MSATRHLNTLFISCILALTTFVASAQHRAEQPWRLKANNGGKNYKDDFKNTDFSKIFTFTDEQYVYGFIGESYQRFQIKFISIKKDISTPDQYLVYGKSMVKGNVDDFNGKLTIKRIDKSPTISWGADDTYKNKGIKGEYMIYGEYRFDENKSQNHSGVFTGTFQTDFYVDKNGRAKYDDIDNISDSFTNNQFTGNWTSYDGKIKQRCNWGDYRIPDCGNLDIGAGEFSPGDEYVKNGWQEFRKNNKQTASKKAIWWK